MLSREYFDGYRAYKGGRAYSLRASVDWCRGWNDAHLEATYDGDLEIDLIGHYEDDF